MPVPAQYQRATDDFYKLLEDTRDISGLGSTHQAYTMVQGVPQSFRRRLDPKAAIDLQTPYRQCCALSLSRIGIWMNPDDPLRISL